MSLTKMRRKMSKAVQPIMYAIAAIFVISCFTLYGSNRYGYSGSPGAKAGADDTNVARVNGQLIPRTLYERAVQIAIRQAEMQAKFAQYGGGRPDFRQLHMARGQAFEQVVDSFLRAQAAEKEGIRVTGAEVRAEADKEIQDEMDTKLDGATPEEKRQFESQLRTLIDEDLIRRKLLTERLEKKLEERFKPTEADMMDSYKEVKARHILVKTTSRTDDEARKRAEEALAKLQKGEDFVKIAKEYSDDPGSKNTGGDVDWITATSGFVPEFADAARKLKKGETSGLVKTMFGYHIIRVDDVRTKVPKDIKDPKKKEDHFEQFSTTATNNKKQSYFANLRLTAKIEPIDPFIAGYITENLALSAQSSDPAEYQRLLAEATKQYEAAAARNDMSAGPPLYAKLAELYTGSQPPQDEKALAAVNKALDGAASAEMYLMKGEILERKKDKAEAVKAYQAASKNANTQPWLFLQLEQKFRSLDRKDLAHAERVKWESFKKEDDKRRAMPVASGGLPAGLPVPTPGG